jgi:uncharacterized pyridoxamine 5'-phosphate oxidase family protein
MQSIKSFKNKVLNSEICYISTSDKEGNPHLKLIWFINYNDELWFETHIPTRTYKNLKENNKVSICFGGKDTYLVFGHVVEYKEKDCPIPFRKLLWQKYPNDMEDSFIRDNTRIYKVIVTKELGWKYSPTWKDIDFHQNNKENIYK